MLCRNVLNVQQHIGVANLHRTVSAVEEMRQDGRFGGTLLNVPAGISPLPQDSEFAAAADDIVWIPPGSGRRE